MCGAVDLRWKDVDRAERSALDALLGGLDLAVMHQADLLSYPMPFADRYGAAAVATRWPHRIVEVLDQRGADAPDVPWCTLAAVGL